MKVIESLNIGEKTELLLNNMVGIFPTMIKSSDTYFSIGGEICSYYYLTHSPQKNISPVIDNIAEVLISTESEQDKYSVIGRIIGDRFRTKWTKSFQYLREEYNPLFDNEEIKTKDGDNTITRTYDNTKKSDENRNYKETVVNDNVENGDIYGFNSTAPVGADKNIGNTTETTEGLFEDNHTENIETHTGSDIDKHLIDEDESIKRRNKSASALINEEIEFRNKREFIEMVCRDINTIFTLNIY